MILSTYAYTKISSANFNYWTSLGYIVKYSQRIKVKVSDLQKNSNVRIACRCDDCGSKYTNRAGRRTDICKRCVSVRNATGKQWSLGKRRELPQMRGENHHAWNPNKSAFQTYRNKVQWLTTLNYRRDIDIINPERLPRSLCGTEGGWQLDHKISVKRGFEMGINPLWIAATDNLQMLPWAENLSKRHN